MIYHDLDIAWDKLKTADYDTHLAKSPLRSAYLPLLIEFKLYFQLLNCRRPVRRISLPPVGTRLSGPRHFSRYAQVHEDIVRDQVL